MARISKSKLLEKLINFFTRSKCSLVGGVIVTILFPILLVSILLDMQGVVENPYFGFLIYMVMGPLFVLGLLLIIGGTLFCGEKEEIGSSIVEYFQEQMNLPGRFSRIRRLIFLTSSITFLTLVIVTVITYTGFHYTETVAFCGQFCHTVMEPEYVTYKNSPHSQVPCVDCHIGEGAEWLTKSKFSGARQLLAVISDSYQRPIPTPIEALRPSRATCEECHRPEVFHGDKLYVDDRFLPDEQNTHVQTVMVMRIGSGGYSGREAQGIHWHVSEDHTVTYVGSKDHEYISEVTLKHNGVTKVYRRKNPSNLVEYTGERTMDCMDCHNRPTHVFKHAAEALNEKLVTGAIPQDIPYIKRQALAAINKAYSSQDAARRGIAKELMDWYRQEYPTIVAQHEEKLNQAVMGTQQAFVENVYPTMNINWETYTSFTGHNDKGGGCFRCHNEEFTTEKGETITTDCTACHIILAENDPARDIVEILRSP